jgi:hypothetical protein
VQANTLVVGLLPKAFSRQAGGTRAAPVELNSENRKDSRLVLTSTEACAIFVGLADEGPVSNFTAIFHASFLENSRSHFPHRAFWLPGWTAKNTVSDYTVSMNDALVPLKMVSER